MDDRQCLIAMPGITKIIGIKDATDKSVKELQLTPYGVAKEQIDMLPEEIFNPQSMFIDIFYKNETYLMAIRERLMKSKYMNVPGLENLENRLIYITRMQLYAICPVEISYKMCTACFSSVQWPHAYIPDKHILKAYGGSDRTPLEALDALIKFKNMSEEQRSEFTSGFKSQELYEFLIDTVNMRENKMKFDVVVGNPPYNNDLYLDFVTKSHALASKYTCMITPAKWQAKTDGKPAKSKTEDKNEAFRRDIVPYMEKIVFYPTSKDLFDISEWGGISILKLCKNKSAEKDVRISCRTNKYLNCDWQKHDEVSPVLLSHKILNVIGKFGQLGEGFKQSLYVKNTDHGESSISGQLGEGFKQSLYVKNTDHGESSISGQLGFKRFTYTSEQERGEKLKQAGMVEVVQGPKVSGYKKIDDLFTTYNLDKYKCITSIMLSGSSDVDSNGYMKKYFNTYILKPYQVPKGSFPILKYCDSMEEAESFVSLTCTRCFMFLLTLGVSGTTLTKEFFRFVPDPNDWTCTYVDAPHPNVVPDGKGYYELDGKRYCSLYVRYNLTDDDIKIIESVIKPRNK